MAVPTRSYVPASAKSPETYESRSARRANTVSSSCSPVATIDWRARSTSCSLPQSSTATPTIGQSGSPRCSRRYKERNVMTFARSPVMPKITKTSHWEGWLMPLSYLDSRRRGSPPASAEVAATEAGESERGERHGERGQHDERQHLEAG